jgi:hypothetical protein
MRAAALSSCAATLDRTGADAGAAPAEEEKDAAPTEEAELASHDLGPSTIRGAILGDPPEPDGFVVVENGDRRFGWLMLFDLFAAASALVGRDDA